MYAIRSYYGWPGFSRSSPLWGDIDLFEVPLCITMPALVNLASMALAADYSQVADVFDYESPNSYNFV